MISRIVYSFNHDSDGHGCGRAQGDEPPCEVTNDLPPIGKTVTHFYAAPGTGSITYRITKHDASGAWGEVLRDTLRIDD